MEINSSGGLINDLVTVNNMMQKEDEARDMDNNINDASSFQVTRFRIDGGVG